jgi:hypothetical protein
MLYKYLNDENFLKQVDQYPRHEIFIKIYILDFKTEKVTASIEGRSTGGNINLSGSSSMRRTGSVTLIADPRNVETYGSNWSDLAKITSIENLISINKKVKIEIGYKNPFIHLGDAYYSNYPVLWFPQGIFIIKAANISKSAQGVNISLTLNDKCAVLNGDVGGTFPAAMILSETEEYNLSGTKVTIKQLLIKDIIKYIVMNFGGEALENIIIEDIPDTILKVMKWGNNQPVYFIDGENKFFTFEKPAEGSYKVFNYGEPIGYEIADFVYPGKLECNAGDSVSSILDKIKATLGNFEWFYDIEGKFHFREQKNYLNSTLTKQKIALAEKYITEKDYLSQTVLSKSAYTFDGDGLILSVSSNPQYINIKNDFVVWGKSKTASGADKPLRYHAVFDSKPDTDISRKRLAIIYQDERTLDQIVFVEMGKNCFRKASEKTAQLNKNYSILNNKQNYYLKKKYKEKKES